MPPKPLRRKQQSQFASERFIAMTGKAFAFRFTIEDAGFPRMYRERCSIRFLRRRTLRAPASDYGSQNPWSSSMAEQFGFAPPSAPAAAVQPLKCFCRQTESTTRQLSARMVEAEAGFQLSLTANVG